MGCVCSQVDTRALAPSSSPGPQDAIREKRSCTDVCFLLLFTAFWVGMICIGITAFSEGDINRILYGLDMFGNICGADDSNYIGGNPPDFTQRKNIYWLDPTEFLSKKDLSTMKTVCLSLCPTDTNKYVCAYDQNWNTDYYNSLSSGDQNSSQNGDGPCYKVLLRTYALLNRCFPYPPETVANISAKLDVTSPLEYEMSKEVKTMASAHSKNVDTGQPQSRFTVRRYDGHADASETPTINDFEKIYDRFAKQFSKSRLVEYLADLWKGYLIILVCGMGGGMAFAFVWIALMRCFAGFMTWTGVVLMNCMLISFTLFCYIKAGKLASSALGQKLEKEIGTLPRIFDPSSDNKKAFEIVAYVMTGITVVAFMLVILLARQIALAVSFIKVASSAVANMPCLLLFPLFPFVLCVMLVLWWLVVVIFLYSDGQVTLQPNGGYAIHWNDTLRYMAVYHLFGLLWTWQFINGIGDVVIAGAVSVFYWKRGEPAGRLVWISMKRALRYHLGSIAFGSLVIAILQFVRLVFEYVKRKTRTMTDDVLAAKFVLGMVRCLLWVLDAMLTFVNRNAYIVVAVKGTSYCPSAGHALALILKNILRVGMVNVISGILIFIGQMMVATTCGVAAFCACEWKPYSDPSSRRHLSSPLFPVLCSAVLGYLISQIFLQIYDMAIDTIVLCFCEDCNLHDNQPAFAPTILMDAFGIRGETYSPATDPAETISMPPALAPPAGGRARQSSSM